MLSIKPIGSSSGEVTYYTHLGQEDYYVGGGEPPGVWWGTGAEQLGVSGQVEGKAFGNLLQGKSADGRKRLVQNAGHPKRRSAFDLTWSVPKSVSVAWSQGDIELRQQIEQAGERAVLKALEVVHEYCGTTRRGHHGERVEQSGIAAALFRHDTARGVKNAAPDPNLHWHTVLLNVCTREDGTTGALDARSLFRPQMKMALGALFRAELSAELSQLGLSSHRPQRNGREASWFELDSIPAELLEAFSKRRKEILDWLNERGLSGAKASEKATNVTKQGKDSWKREDLLKAWQAIGETYGFDSELLGSETPLEIQPLSQRDVEEAATAIARNDSHFSELSLLRRVAENAQCRGLGIDEVRKTIAEALVTSQEIVSLQEVNGVRRFTTREILAVERKLLDAVERSSGWRQPHVMGALSEVLQNFPTIRPEQRDAVKHVTCSPDRISCVYGMAGTGKTFLLDVAREVWERSGYEVIGTALAAKAAQGLEEGSGIRSLHIHSLLKQIELGRESLSAKSVLVVDEAGMVGTAMMERLVRLTEEVGARLVLVGDYRQLQSIDAGGCFKAICEKLGAAELLEITRQRDDWARDAVKEMAAGDADMALSRYHSKGLLFVSEDRTEAMRSLVTDWQNSGSARQSLIFAGTRYETAILNRLCQEKRLEDGILGVDSISVGSEEIHVGDRVLFTRNNAALLVRNGNTGTVLEIDTSQNTVRVELDSGYRIVIDLATFDHLALGYAVTTHKGQGQTVESAFVLAGGSMTDRELSYVQTSRSRGETRIYTDAVSAGENLSALSRQMQQSRAKDMAHEYLIEAV